MNGNNISRPDFSKAKNKGGGGGDGSDGRYIIQILERLTKVETQISHLASKEDMANLRTDMANTRTDMANRITSIYKALWFSTSTMVAIVGGAVIKTFFFS